MQKLNDFLKNNNGKITALLLVIALTLVAMSIMVILFDERAQNNQTRTILINLQPGDDDETWKNGDEHDDDLEIE